MSMHLAKNFFILALVSIVSGPCFAMAAPEALESEKELAQSASDPEPEDTESPAQTEEAPAPNTKPQTLLTMPEIKSPTPRPQIIRREILEEIAVGGLGLLGGVSVGGGIGALLGNGAVAAGCEVCYLPLITGFALSGGVIGSTFGVHYAGAYHNKTANKYQTMLAAAAPAAVVFLMPQLFENANTQEMLTWLISASIPVVATIRFNMLRDYLKPPLRTVGLGSLIDRSQVSFRYTASNSAAHTVVSWRF